MSFAVILTRLCPRGNLPHKCGDVPDGLKPRGHIESQNPRAESPPNTHGDFFILVILWCCFQASFCFVLQRHLRTDRVRFIVNPYSEMVGYTRSDTLAVIRG